MQWKKMCLKPWKSIRIAVCASINICAFLVLLTHIFLTTVFVFSRLIHQDFRRFGRGDSCRLYMFRTTIRFFSWRAKFHRWSEIPHQKWPTIPYSYFFNESSHLNRTKQNVPNLCFLFERLKPHVRFKHTYRVK